MIRIQKRNTQYHIDCHTDKLRLRGSLGTKDKTVASRLKSRLELAMAEGARSENWVDLRHSLPATTYDRFAKAKGVKAELVPTWANLASIFWTSLKVAPNSRRRYEYAVEAFEGYLQDTNTLLADITPHVMDEYQTERHAQILARPNSRNGNGLTAEISVLRSVFQLAVDRHMIAKNPVRKGFTPKETEVNPFSGQELAAMREACETDDEWVIYTVLRHTGMRVSDCADLQWPHVHNGEIVKRTLKRGKIVHIPMTFPLASLAATIKRPEGYVITIKNKPVSTAQIRSIVRLISQRAKVSNGHPHRFRHSFCCDLLMKGCSPYEVGQIVGDTAATVEKHYLKFVPAMRDKVKGMLDDTTKGLEAG